MHRNQPPLAVELPRQAARLPQKESVAVLLQPPGRAARRTGTHVRFHRELHLPAVAAPQEIPASRQSQQELGNNAPVQAARPVGAEGTLPAAPAVVAARQRQRHARRRHKHVGAVGRHVAGHRIDGIDHVCVRVALDPVHTGILELLGQRDDETLLLQVNAAFLDPVPAVVLPPLRKHALRIERKLQRIDLPQPQRPAILLHRNRIIVIHVTSLFQQRLRPGELGLHVVFGRVLRQVDHDREYAPRDTAAAVAVLRSAHRVTAGGERLIEVSAIDHLRFLGQRQVAIVVEVRGAVFRRTWSKHPSRVLHAGIGQEGADAHQVRMLDGQRAVRGLNPHHHRAGCQDPPEHPPPRETFPVRGIKRHRPETARHPEIRSRTPVARPLKPCPVSRPPACARRPPSTKPDRRSHPDYPTTKPLCTIGATMILQWGIP